MKISFGHAAAGLAALAVSAGAADVTGEMSLWSKYLWRGLLFTDDPVLQPSLDVATDCGIGFNVWMNIDLTDVNAEEGDATKGRPTEIDVTAVYGLPLDGLVRAEVAAAAYVVSKPAAASGTTADACLRAWLDPSAAGADAWPALLPSPSVAVYYEFLEIHDVYVSFALDSSHDLSAAVSLAVGASLGYGSKAYNAYFFSPGDDAPRAETNPPDRPRIGGSCFNDLSFNVELGWQATEALRLALMGQYTVLVENPVKSAARALFGDREWLLGGLKASWSF